MCAWQVSHLNIKNETIYKPLAIALNMFFFFIIELTKFRGRRYTVTKIIGAKNITGVWLKLRLNIINECRI